MRENGLEFKRLLSFVLSFPKKLFLFGQLKCDFGRPPNSCSSPPPSISSASFSDSRHSLSVHSSSSSGPARPVKAPGGRARSVGRKRTILGLDDPAKKFPSLSMSVCALVIPPCLFYSFSSSLSSFRKRAAILKSSTVAHSPILDEEKINKTRSLKPGG